MFVFDGFGDIGTQPNNGLVISSDPGNGFRFRFFCRSNSSTLGVGELIGLDESPVTDGSTFGFETPRDGGELRVENIVGTHSVLTASEQGVYTCRIPLEGGEMRELNIGVYPSGFSSELFHHEKFFAGLEYTHSEVITYEPITGFSSYDSLKIISMDY